MMNSHYSDERDDVVVQEKQHSRASSEEIESTTDVDDEGITEDNEGRQTLDLDEAQLNDFWKQHDEWKQSIAQRCIRVHVGDGVQGQRSLMNPNPPVYYSVETRALNASVQRRYSDFEWLKDALKVQFPGTVVPSLPEKKAVGNHTSSFLKQRSRGLQRFLSEVVKVPYFAVNTAVTTFLTTSDEVKWDMYQKSFILGSQKGLLVDNDDARARWSKALAYYRIPSNHGNIINALRIQLDVLEKLITSLVTAASKLVSISKQYSDAIGEVNQCFSSLSDSIYPDILNALQEFGLTMGECYNASLSETGIYDSLLVESLQVELTHVRDLKKVCNNRDTLVRTVEQLKTTASKLDAELAGLQNPPKPDKINKVRLKIMETKNTLAQTQDELTQVTKALFFMEVDLYGETKTQQIISIKKTLAQAQVEYLARLSDIWAKSLAE